MSGQLTIVGRLGADPELEFTSGGMPMLKMRVVSSRRKEVNGEWVDVDTTWWRVTAFRKLAENGAEHLRKGDLVVIVGVIKGNDYETKTGEKRRDYEVVANTLGLDLSRPPKATGGGAKVSESDPWASPGVSSTFDDETPF